MKYTKKDVIIFADDERLKKASGKLCYFNNNALSVLADANNDGETGELFTVLELENKPFVVTRDNKARGYSFIILKKEPEKKIVPFDYELEEDRVFLRGKWIRGKNSTDGLDEMQIIAIQRPFAQTVDASIGCDALLRDYVFLDGTPCGKEVE